MSSIHKQLYLWKEENKAIKLAQQRGEQVIVIRRDDIRNLPPKEFPNKERLIFVVTGHKVGKIYEETALG